MVTLTVTLDEREMEHLLSWAHLTRAEDLDENPDTIRTEAGDIMPTDVDRNIYAALAEAALDYERR